MWKRNEHPLYLSPSGVQAFEMVMCALEEEKNRAKEEMEKNEEWCIVCALLAKQRSEQLPVGSQKSLPDQAPYMRETASDVSEGVSRDEETLQPTVYLNKLPEKFPEGARIFVVDPMLATGVLF
ncbi:hypothetical protein BVRB_004560 [Beta vulgaris subsp. vulgaris]|uniref:Phosphoribosyltransferase domain-containing protein n=1 Tax=Beta vulgaris subsp. vulgaris TaxID=3555 RepID=A0A0J8B7R3_BETVV|nr:hypothetical protein BVRB_004560 [Beta vulgaris subsp. vulgaris]